MHFPAWRIAAPTDRRKDMEEVRALNADIRRRSMEGALGLGYRIAGAVRVNDSEIRKTVQPPNRGCTVFVVIGKAAAKRCLYIRFRTFGKRVQRFAKLPCYSCIQYDGNNRRGHRFTHAAILAK